MSFYKKHKTVIDVLLLFLISRLPMIIFFLLHKSGIGMLNKSGIGFIDNITTTFLYTYDGSHYLEIASSGYYLDKLYAFFPLYPILIRILHMFHISYSTAGILISNFSNLISIFVLYIMLKKKSNKNIYLYMFVLSPILAFTTMCYTESLYIMLSLLSFYFYKKKEYLISAFFLGLAMLTRNTGFILLLAIFIDMLYRYKKKNDIKLKNIFIFLFVSVSIGMIYPIYLYFKTVDLFYFSTIQFTYWLRANGYVIFTIINDIKYLYHHLTLADSYIFFLNWSFFLISLFLSIKLFKKDKVSSIYIFISLIFFTLSYRIPYSVNNVAPEISLFRYIFTLFPIYLYLPSLKFKNINVNVILLTFYFSITLINVVAVYFGAFIA